MSTDRIQDTAAGAASVSHFAAKVIRPDGTVVSVFPQNGRWFTLEELQAFVGGYIEMLPVPSKTGAVVFCDEEGKLKGRPRNRIATQLWQEHAEPGSMRMLDDVVGDVVICHRSQLESDESA